MASAKGWRLGRPRRSGGIWAHWCGGCRGWNWRWKDWQTGRGWAGKGLLCHAKGPGLYAADAGMQEGILRRQGTRQAIQVAEWRLALWGMLKAGDQVG